MFQTVKVRKRAKIRNRYNQAPDPGSNRNRKYNFGNYFGSFDAQLSCSIGYAVTSKSVRWYACMLIIIWWG